jgi:UDP-glucose:(heptosyl)LPS alpha-1,3-glucosyltransferase
MRIGLPMKFLDSGRGGLEVYTTRLGRWLSAHGHEVHLFAEHIAEQPPGVRIHRVRPFLPETVRDAARAERLDVLVGSDKIVGMNVFQPHGGTVPGNMRQVIARWRNPLIRRTLTLLNEINPKYRAAIRLEREQYSQQQPRPHFVAVSQRIAEEMQQLYRAPQDRLHVVYNGVDAETFCPEHCARLRTRVRRSWDLPAEAVCFLLVAHDFHLKGLCELIMAAARLLRISRNFRIIVVGRGNPRPFLRQARRLGCDQILHFTGPMRQVAEAYAAADVYVHPSWYDAFSLAVLEAWACGLPVITTRFTGASELMKPGQQGLLIDSPADTDALVDCMSQLLDPNRRHAMGTRGRQLAERHTEEDNFRRVLKICEQAAAEDPVGRRLNAA